MKGKVKEIRTKGKVMQDVLTCNAVKHEPRHLRANAKGDYCCVHCGAVVWEKGREEMTRDALGVRYGR